MPLANNAASAVVMCLPKDDTSVFHAFRSLRATPTQKLVSFVVFTNSANRFGWSGYILSKACVSSVEFGLQGLPQVTSLCGAARIRTWCRS
jgi:hypothetical protein